MAKIVACSSLRDSSRTGMGGPICSWFFFCPFWVFFAFVFCFYFIVVLFILWSRKITKNEQLCHFTTSLQTNCLFSFSLTLFLTFITYSWYPANLINLFIHLFILLFRAAPTPYGSSQARSRIGTTAADPQHGHSNTGSKLCLRPAPQLTAAPDPWPTEQGQRLNPYPHGY